jgi:hypothetical protein
MRLKLAQVDHDVSFTRRTRLPEKATKRRLDTPQVHNVQLLGSITFIRIYGLVISHRGKPINVSDWTRYK